MCLCNESLVLESFPHKSHFKFGSVTCFASMCLEISNLPPNCPQKAHVHLFDNSSLTQFSEIMFSRSLVVIFCPETYELGSIHSLNCCFVYFVNISFVTIKNQLILIRIATYVTKPRFASFRHMHKFHMSSGIIFSSKSRRAQTALKLITIYFLYVLALYA